MEPFNGICLAAVGFLSLPLPIFASVVLNVRPAVRKLIMPCVWINILVVVLATLMIQFSTWPLTPVLVAGGTFLVCGMEFCRRLAAHSPNSMDAAHHVFTAQR